MTLPNNTESSTQKILIAGETSISVNIANDLSNSSYEIIFVSESIDTLQKLPETKISEGHIKAINTDITDINSFEKHIEEEVDIFLALTNSDSIIGFMCQIMKHNHNIPITVCVIENANYLELYNNLGIKTINRTSLMIESITNSLN